MRKQTKEDVEKYICESLLKRYGRCAGYDKNNTLEVLNDEDDDRIVVTVTQEPAVSTTWIKTEDKLPPANTIVRVRLVNDCESFDFVNEPLDKGCPFKHFLVREWRAVTSEELQSIWSNIYDSVRKEQV